MLERNRPPPHGDQVPLQRPLSSRSSSSARPRFAAAPRPAAEHGALLRDSDASGDSAWAWQLPHCAAGPPHPRLAPATSSPTGLRSGGKCFSGLLPHASPVPVCAGPSLGWKINPPPPRPSADTAAGWAITPTALAGVTRIPTQAPSAPQSPCRKGPGARPGDLVSTSVTHVDDHFWLA